MSLTMQQFRHRRSVRMPRIVITLVTPGPTATDRCRSAATERRPRSTGGLDEHAATPIRPSFLSACADLSTDDGTPVPATMDDAVRFCRDAEAGREGLARDTDRPLRGLHLLLRSRPDEHLGRPRLRARPRPAAPRTLARHRMGSRPPALGARRAGADGCDEQHLYLWSLAGHRPDAWMAALETSAPVPHHADGDGDLRTHRVRFLRALPDGPAPVLARAGIRGYRHAGYVLVPGAAAAGGHEPVRGAAQSPRWLEPADGDRDLADDAARRVEDLRGGDAVPDVGRHDPDGEPLRARRRRWLGGRIDGATRCGQGDEGER